MSEQEQGPEEAVEELLSGKKTLQGRLTRMHNALKSWDEIGGISEAIRKVEIVQEGLAEYKKSVDDSIEELQRAQETRRKEHQEILYRALEDYAQNQGLSFDGSLGHDPTEPVTVEIGDYNVRMEPGEEAEVLFANETVGTLSATDEDELAKEFEEIRAAVEVETDRFVPRLKRAYDKVTGSRGGKAKIGQVLRHFIADLQPPEFWEQAAPQNLEPYSQVNFAWEVLRVSREEGLPFQVTEASVHANVSAAGGRGEKGEAIYLVVRGVDKPRLYSHMTWTKPVEESG